MNTLGELKAAVVDFLSLNAPGTALDGAKLLSEFPAARRPVPLLEPLIAVGIEGVELREGGLGGYYGEQSGDGGALYGRTAEVTFSFTLQAPPALGGEGLHTLYEGLCDLLLLGEGAFGFFRMTCGAIGHDGAGGANTLKVTAVLRAAVTHADRSLPIGQFLVRRTETSE